jgi:hypothetical protein
VVADGGEIAVVVAGLEMGGLVEVELLVLGLCCAWPDEFVEVVEGVDFVLARGSMYC